MTVRDIGTSPGDWRWSWVLVAMTGALALIYIDQTAVAVALPAISDHLHLSGLGQQWVINAYLLAMTATVAIGGRVGDLYGRRRLFVAGTTLLALGSLACALAESEVWMMGGRVLQGIGAGTMMPNATGLLADSYPADQRGRALGICLGVSAGFLAVGPVIGGLLVDAFGWRSVFLINLPVIACVSGLVLLHVPGGRGRADEGGGESGDALGAATLIAGVVAVVIALMQASAWGWASAATIGLGAAGGALIATAIARELRVRAPFFNLRLFARRMYVGATLGVSVNRLAVVIATVYASIYFQQARGLDASTAGLALLALAVPTALVAPLAGRAADRLGSAAVCNFGMAATAIGLFAVAIGVEAGGLALVIAGLVPIAIGSGAVQPSANLATMNAVGADEEAEAFGLMAGCRQLGGTLGLAVVGGIVTSAGFASGFFVTAAIATAGAVVTAMLLRARLRARS